MFYINIDASALQDLLDIGDAANDAMASAARDLSAATRGKIVELAQEKLHTRRSMYLDALTHFQLDDNTFVVNLDKSARWIEDGMPEHSMLDDLLKSKKVKRAKDGSAYLIVPFQHNKGKSSLSPAQQGLLATIKKELAKVGATPNKIEMDSGGKPKLGLVRSLDITKAPISSGAHPIGKGPRGHVAQSASGTPLLKGVRIYQKEIKDKSGESKIGRFVMTFRVASSKQKGGLGPAGSKWDHPGLQAANLMEEGMKWAMDQWENKVAPQIMASIVASLS
jgi:hypothetical protein